MKQYEIGIYQNEMTSFEEYCSIHNLTFTNEGYFVDRYRILLNAPNDNFLVGLGIYLHSHRK